MPAGLTSLEFVTVGNPGNGADTRYASSSGFGAVDYRYRIGKFEVTAGQYTEFLNAVAKTDTYSLYDPNMWFDSLGCKIQRSGSPGAYSYSIAAGYANRPVNRIGWGDAARFTNWLHNGQPSGAQNASTTEDGAYFLNGATTNSALVSVPRKSQAIFAIPTVDEWYKAAFYDPNKAGGPGYWDYPTRTNTPPGRDMADTTGNNANYYEGSGAYPIDSHYTTVVGEFQNSPSAFGTFDQAGNLFEWNESTPHGLYRGRWGGSFGDQRLYQLASTPSYTNPAAVAINTGLRVVFVPEPATLTLLALGAAGLHRRRRPAV
jgi:formylglycine-generating enzyme required for sulfatase activity